MSFAWIARFPCARRRTDATTDGIRTKRTIPSAGLAVLPRTGHTLNLEEPELFNRLVGDFLTTVDAGRWGLRDPRSVSRTLTGISG
jgi:hypothetical protein